MTASSSTTTTVPSGTPSYFIGVWGDNILQGTGASEMFYAPGGKEVMTGGGSHDVFIVDSEVQRMEITNFNPAQDVLYVGSSTGAGSLQALGTHGTAAGLEIDFSSGAVVVLDGIAAASALNQDNVSFFGGAYTPPPGAAPTTTLANLAGTTPTYIVGAWGSHQLHGTGATEVFYAPGGSEVLTGGGSRDVFIVDSEIQRLEITNFNSSQDVLFIGSSAGVASLQTLAGHVHGTAAGLEIDFPNGAVVVLDGITSVSALTTANTAFFQGAYTPPSSTTTTPTAPPQAPTVAAVPATLVTGQSVAVSSLFSATAPSATPISEYYLYDANGAVHLNGATNLDGTGRAGYYQIAAADLSKLTYVAGAAGTANLDILADDGAFSNWAYETITVHGSDAPPTSPPTSTPTAPPQAPTVAAVPATLVTGQSVAVSSLFSATAPSATPISEYYLYDANGAVHLNGATNLDGTGRAGYYQIAAADLSKLTYVAGAAGTANLDILADDGAFSNWAYETITVHGSDAPTTSTPTSTSTSSPPSTSTSTSTSTVALATTSVPLPPSPSAADVTSATHSPSVAQPTSSEQTISVGNASSEYSFSTSAGAVVMTAVTGPSQGSAMNVTNALSIAFSDKSVFIAHDQQTAMVGRLYEAALGRAPDAAGLAGWVSAYETSVPASTQVSSAGLTTQAMAGKSIADAFISSGEFQSKYGNLNDGQFVTQLYQNVLQRAPDASGLAAWVQALSTAEAVGGATAAEARATVLASFSESGENQSLVGLTAQHPTGWLITA